MPAPLSASPRERPARIVELAPVLDLKAASPLVAELLACRGDELMIDGSKVVRIGGQCLQVLLAAAITWRADDAPFAIVDASPELADGARRMGVDLADLTDRDPVT